MITYRLADALPAHVVARMQRELAACPESRRHAQRRRRIQILLDAGYGTCALAHPACARCVEENLHHFDGIRYHLLGWVVMPNHVHVMIQPEPGWRLDQIVHSWKSYTSNRIQAIRRVPNAGALWQREYFDRFIRDQRHYRNALDYLHDNPVQAGLCSSATDWPCSSARYAS